MTFRMVVPHGIPFWKRVHRGEASRSAVDHLAPRSSAFAIWFPMQTIAPIDCSPAFAATF